MKVEKTKIKGLLIITPEVFEDSRGYLFENYSIIEYEKIGLPSFVQDNLSLSKKRVLRGLHYQLPPFSQGKLIRVIKGRILDVAVDLRPNSDSFGKYVSIELSDENKKQFWIPPGFAHGFLTLSENAYVYYKCSAYYNKKSERGIIWNDPTIKIKWGVKKPILSENDTKNKLLKDNY